MDECKDSSRKCHFDADCTNTEGSYSCLCKSGYFGDGFTCEKGEFYNNDKKRLYSSHSICRTVENALTLQSHLNYF